MNSYEVIMIGFSCAVADALKNIDQRLLLLEIEVGEAYPRQDAVWEKLDIMRRDIESLESMIEHPQHGDDCNCWCCRKSRGGEPV